MADSPKSNKPESSALNESKATPASHGDGSPGAGGASPSNAPRPAVPKTGEGYPDVDTLSYDPEGRDWMSQTRRWIEQNPGLAVLGAAAAGLIIGRAVAAAIPEPQPATFSEKVEERARELAKHGKYAASDAGDVVGKQLAVAAHALGEASKAVAEGTRKGYAEAKDFGEFLSENIGKAVAEKATKWIDSR